MSNLAVQETGRSVIQDMADRFGMDKRAFESTLKATVVPANVSNEQFAAFLLVAREYNLNPLTKEIYAFPAKGGGIQPIVGIDGWCNIINSHPQFDGMSFEDHMTDGKLTAVTCQIHRKDRSHSISATEYMDECKKTTEPWTKWPARMLRHKALIQCARYAFGFSGIVEPDEAERMIDVTPQAANNSEPQFISNEVAVDIDLRIDALKDADIYRPQFLKYMKVDRVDMILAKDEQKALNALKTRESIIETTTDEVSNEAA